MEIELNSVSNVQEIEKNTDLSSLALQDYRDIIALLHDNLPRVQMGSKALIANKSSIVAFDAEFTAQYGAPGVKAVATALAVARKVYEESKAAIWHQVPVSCSSMPQTDRCLVDPVDPFLAFATN
jgi:hypothetical protein